MLFQRFFLEPLAQAAYLIADGEDAVVVDPRRDVDDLLAFASERRLKIRWVLATHTHADFVAGLREVAAATGARIGMGDKFAGELQCERLRDDAVLDVGGARIRVLATPGHTMDSVCYLVQAPPGGAEPLRLCSGDTLFLGDVGRPDLAAGRGHAPRDMARRLFASLQRSIAPLPDATEVWPAHGAGSPCGTNISCEASSTMAQQRLANWALGERDVERFCERLVSAQPPPPAYFGHVVDLNLHGPRLLAELPLPGRQPAAACARLAAGAVVLDVRAADAHAQGHWPGALNLGGDYKDFEMWAGALLPAEAPLVLHAASAGQAQQVWLRLLRIGKERMLAWTDELPPQTARHPRVPAVELFAAQQKEPSLQVLDVRRPAEFEAGHVAGAQLATLSPALASAPAVRRLDPRRRTFVICRTGYRSSAAVAQLAAAGFADVVDVGDGMQGWLGNHLPVATGATATS
jgi:glyoxylase-like metal-dependent hydrolase (beta-lactamase superfamily II)/rhodanese-related sulfurtransferase